MSGAPTFISAERCQQLLAAGDVISVVEQAWAWDAAGSVQWPSPRNLNIAPDRWGNDYHMKACVLEEIPVAGLRLVSHPMDESSPNSTRLILLIDPATTLLLAIVDETWSYQQRTVAAIAVAVKQVAIPGPTALAVIGAGRLARTAVDYFSEVLTLDEIRVASRTAGRRDALVADVRAAYDVDVRPFDSVEDAVRGAGLVLTATSASTAVLEEPWIQPGAVVACVGTAEPGPDFAAAADLFLVDSREQLRKELVAEFGEQAPDWVTATVGDVVAGKHPGRVGAADRVLVITEGMANQDIALAHLAYQRHLQQADA